MLSDLHPIVTRMAPSTEQEPAIRARGRDIAVLAGAGTGKTRTLVCRYLALLAEGVPMRSIVAITFTRKAAREMRNRVREAVRAYLEEPALDATQLARWQEIYTALDAARIGTIHSLCTEILRHHPAEAALDPRFDVLDEGQTALLRAQVVDEVMAWAADDAVAVDLFPALGERTLRQLGRWCLEQRLELDSLADTLPDDQAMLLARWDAALAVAREAAWESFVSDPTLTEALDTLCSSAPLDPDDLMAQQRQMVLDALSREDLSPEETYAVLGSIALRGGKPGSWIHGKAELDQVKASLQAMRELYRAQAPWLTLSLSEADRELAALYPASHALRDRLARQYALRKAQRRALDFDDLEAGAVALLREHEAVRSYWRREVRALLVDEFQDTNGRQRDLLDLLNGDEGRVFIVGDGKQSIYRFRGADVSVFRGVCGDIEVAGESFRLDTSYRAHRDLISLLNALLEPVLGPAGSAVRPWIEPFAPLAPVRPHPIAGIHAPFVELHLAPGTKSEGAMERAADALARRLVALVGESESKAPAVDGRLNYGDIAILCRASTSFAAYEDALEAHGVPFITVAGRGFYDRPEIRDVINALQAIDDATDDLALAGLLRSPICGLSDMALFRLRTAQQESGERTLWSRLCHGDEGVLAEEQPLVERARELIQGLREMAGRATVAEVLKALLDASDYWAVLLRAGQSRGARNLSKLLSDAYASEMVSIGSFLEYIQQLRDVGTRDGEARTLSEGAVQLLSVHAAKGLEFPVVVLGDIGWQGTTRRDPLIDPQLGLLLPIEIDDALPATYLLAQQREKEQEDAEARRLLYVAATRAEDMLLVSGVLPSKARGWWAYLQEALAPDGIQSDGATACIECELGAHTVPIHLYAETWDMPQQRGSDRPREAEALPVALPLMAPLHGADLVYDEDARDAAMDPPRRVWRVVPVTARATAPAWVVGKIVHDALIVNDALALWRVADDPDGVAMSSWAEAQAAGCGITADAERRDAARRALRLLARFRETSLYREIARAERRHHEVPYSMPTAEGMEYGVIDLLYQTDGRWILVEFKTDDLRARAPGGPKAAIADHVEQIHRYQRAAERLLGTLPVGRLCLLNYAGAVRWVEVD